MHGEWLKIRWWLGLKLNFICYKKKKKIIIIFKIYKIRAFILELMAENMKAHG